LPKRWHAVVPSWRSAVRRSPKCWATPGSSPPTIPSSSCWRSPSCSPIRRAASRSGTRRGRGPSSCSRSTGWAASTPKHSKQRLADGWRLERPRLHRGDHHRLAQAGSRAGDRPLLPEVRLFPVLAQVEAAELGAHVGLDTDRGLHEHQDQGDRKSTRLNSSHGSISYAVFCLKKKKH